MESLAGVIEVQDAHATSKSVLSDVLRPGGTVAQEDDLLGFPDTTPPRFGSKQQGKLRRRRVACDVSYPSGPPVLLRGEWP